MSSPAFFSDGSTPRIGDTLRVATEKLLGAVVDGGGTGGGGNGQTLSGLGSPEGAQAAKVGSTYEDISVDPPGFWVKFSGTDVTGWRQLIG